MAKVETVVCDVCEAPAVAKCAICERDICDAHNFGGKHSVLEMFAMVYNARVFEADRRVPGIDVCGDCTDILKKHQHEFAVPEYIMAQFVSEFHRFIGRLRRIKQGIEPVQINLPMVFSTHVEKFTCQVCGEGEWTNIDFSKGPRWTCPKCGTRWYWDPAGRLWSSDKHSNV